MIEKIFTNLTMWRNLPSYQLERRADIFFSIYLQDILTEKVGTDDWFIIPEFPIPIKVLDKNNTYNTSFKVDYLAIGKQLNRVLFIELKTDNCSRREKQDRYLLEAKRVELLELLKGLKEIFLATNSKRKYYYLFSMLEDLGLVSFDIGMKTKIQNSLPGMKDEIKKIEVVSSPITQTLPEVIYIQPTGSGPNIVDFEFIKMVISQKYDDEVTTAFARNLQIWASNKAGEL